MLSYAEAPGGLTVRCIPWPCRAPKKIPISYQLHVLERVKNERTLLDTVRCAGRRAYQFRWSCTSCVQVGTVRSSITMHAGHPSFVDCSCHLCAYLGTLRRYFERGYRISVCRVVSDGFGSSSARSRENSNPDWESAATAAPDLLMALIKYMLSID